MGIQINGQTDTVTSTTSGGSVTVTPVRLPNISGVTTVSAGSTSAPSITPTGDSNTGIFFPSADTIAFSEGGVEVIRINSSGNTGIGTNNPISKLTVGGDIELLTSIPGSVNEGGQVILRSSPSGGGGGTKYRMNIDNYYGTTGTSSNVYAFRFFREDDADAANGAVLASLDASGRWRVPSQPAFDAVYTTPNGSTGTQTTNTEIVFNVANTNTGSYFSTSTGRFTAPVAGTYFFSMFGMSDINAAVWYDIRKNGSLITYPHNPYTSTSSPAFRSVGFSVILTLAVNDYVSVFTAGTACGMYGGGNNHNGFCGYLIG